MCEVPKHAYVPTLFTILLITVGANRGLLTLKFLALKKKTGFPPVKNTSQIFFDFCLPLFYATFQCGPYNIFKKNLN